MGILRVLQQVTLPSFGMMYPNSQLASAHPFLSLFIFFCHHHHMECFLFSNLRIFCYLYFCVHGCLVYHSFHLFFICSSAGFSQPYGWVGLGLEVSRFPHFWGGGQGMCPGSLGCGVSGLFSSIFFSPHPLKKEKPYVPLGHQSSFALWLQLCNI